MNATNSENQSMKCVAMVLFVFLTGCTTFYSARTGKPIWRTYADLSQVSVSITIPGEGTYILTAVSVNHTRPISANYHGISNILGEVALGIAPFSGGPTAIRLAAPLASGAAQFKAVPNPMPTPSPVKK